ncbi:MAG: phosphoribosylamine--glycine ligase, partial [Sneathiella sp.]|nr:phosphoribosylamine--glycine ligase [Sneathiella sp.]
MNVLVIGSGGREHALCWALSRSEQVSTLYCAPGNGGISDMATCVPLDTSKSDAVIDFCQAQEIGFVVVGPEAPLVDGLVDDLSTAGIPAFGPRKGAAALEGSKGFMKDLCREYNIPTAAYERFSDAVAAKEYLKSQKMPIVIKADGLAAGKGVIIAQDIDEANATIDDILGGMFGSAGAELDMDNLEAETIKIFSKLASTRSKTLLPTPKNTTISFTFGNWA